MEILAEKYFSHCPYLCQVTFPGSRLAERGDAAFDCCAFLNSICIPAELE
jgi:hypothetical protein